MPTEESNYEESRYARLLPLPGVGIEGMKNIRKAKATVVGLGGLGSVTATLLTALGIGYLRVIDRDIVERSNLQRQTMYRETDVGKTKAPLAKKFLENLNPDVEVEAHVETVSAKTTKLVVEGVDFVIDALDSFSSRFAVNRACLKADKPFLFGAVSGLNGNAMTVIKGQGPCIECLFGHVKDEELPSTMETGIHPAILRVIGSIQISEATKIMLAQEPALVGKLHFCDIGNMTFEKLPVKSKADCSCSQYFQKGSS